MTDDAHKRALVRRGRRLELITLGWDGAEAVVAITAGALAGSAALLGFGFDSVIESVSGSILLWRLIEGEHREELALKLVGASFFLVAGYIAFDAISALVEQSPPGVSYVGIALAGVAVVIMPWLARAKRRVAAEIGSRALGKDSVQSDICAWLSGILLAGLALNALFGWWWADPSAALAMVPILVNEGREAFEGDPCC